MSAPRRRSSLVACLLLAPVGGCVMPSVLGELDQTESGSGSGSDTESEHDSQTGNVSEGSGDGGASSGSAGDTDADDSNDSGSQVADEPWEVPEQCATVAAESAYCLTVAADRYHLVGVDTGATCALGVSGAPIYSPSIAWRGMSVVTCGGNGIDHTFIHHHLLDGTRDVSAIECGVVTSWGDQLVATTGHADLDATLRIFDDFAALDADAPSSDLGFNLEGTRMWTDGEIVLDAWHSTDTIWRHTLSGEPLPDVVLEGHDGWINGMAIVDGVLLVLTPAEGLTTTLLEFDPETGAALDSLELDGLQVPNGLRCRPGTGG